MTTNHDPGRGMDEPIRLPRHRGGMSIEVDPHRTSYQTVAEWLVSQSWRSAADDFESEEARQRAIDTDTLVEIQWYPATPIGFFRVYGPTFEEALAYALKVDAEDMER
jgi:hypothetical protein